MPCAWCSADLDITCCVVCIVTSLQAGGSGVWFVAGGRTVFFSSKFHLPLSGYQVSSPGMKLATHRHLLPRLRIGGAVPPLLLCVFVVWSWVYYGTWVFVTVFTTAQCWIVLRASTIPSIYAYIVCRRPSFQVPWSHFISFSTFMLHVFLVLVYYLHTNIVIVAWSIYFCAPLQLSWAYE